MALEKTALGYRWVYLSRGGGLLAMLAMTLLSHNALANPIPPASSPTSADDSRPVKKTVAKPASITKSTTSPKAQIPHPVMAVIRQQLGLKTGEDETDGSQTSRQQVTNVLAKLAPGKSADTVKQPPKTSAAVEKKMSEAEALADFYAKEKRQPIWVSKTALTPKAHDLIKAFKQADAWGLRSKDFALSQQDRTAISRNSEQMVPADLARIEIALGKLVFKYARYAKGGRIDPKRLSRFQDRGPTVPDPQKTLAAIANAKEPTKTLRAFHPQHPQFDALRKKLSELSATEKPSPQNKKTKKARFPVKGPTLRFGMKHAQVTVLRKRLDIKGDKPAQFDEDVRAGVMNFQQKNGLGTDGIVGPGTRRALAGLRTTKKQSPEKLRARILINMERWRWMPERLQGDNNIYVWANVPELRVRIIRQNKVVFVERVIAGLPGKQSPMFSDKMEWIEFNPTWFIPNSIKVADILPSLRGKGRVMSRYHLRLDCGKFGTDFSSIDWKKVDIRKCAVIQPAGAKSVLGKLKFKFPNKHSVYMHDTLTPALFNRKHRILSHGCIRIRNPRRMAEVLLANDKGMSSKRVGSLLAGRRLHTERLKKSIPVHITYFSTRISDDGKLSHYPDYYGHDKRLASALLGKGHLFKGAIYSGRKRYKRKKRRPKPEPSSSPSYFPGQ